MPGRVLGRSLAHTKAFALVKGARRVRRAGKREQGCERALKKPTCVVCIRGAEMLHAC
jgi:hypothetical protein